MCITKNGRRALAGRQGKILLSLTLVFGTLLAFGGLAIDMGRVEFFRRRIQTAADAGAIGGVRELQVNGSTNIVTAARDDSKVNGYENGVNGATVTVDFPPATGPHAGDNRYLEVVVAKPYPMTFMKVVKLNTVTLKARAVGGLGPSDYCIIALNPAASGAINVAGNTNVQVLGCSVMDDSNNATSLTVTGNSSCLTAKSIDVVGNYSSGSGNGNGCPSPPLQPTPKIGATYVYDPLAYLSAPTFGGCDQTDYSTNKTVTLNPGVYCGGIKISGNNNTVTFNPGTYVLLGGGLQTSGGGTVQGTGVTFYSTGDSTYAFDDFKLNGNTTFNWAAPTSGTYEGILYFQDRSKAGSSQGNVINGTNASSFNGVFYAAGGKFTYTGNSAATGYTGIIADTITFTGNSTLRSNYSTLTNGNPVRNGALME